MRTLGYEKVDVLGVSWGGALAQHLAVGFPRVVDRLVLCAAVPGWPSVPGRPAALRILLGRRRYTDPDYLRRVAPTLYGGRVRREPELLADQISARATRPPGAWGYLGQMFAAMTFTNWPTMKLVRSPTLVIASDDDPIVPLVNARILACGIPDATLHVIEGGGHLFVHTEPDDVAAVVERFLDRAVTEPV